MNLFNSLAGSLLALLMLVGCTDYNEDEEFTSYVAADIYSAKSEVLIYEVVAAGIDVRTVGNARVRWFEWGLWNGPSTDVVFDCTNCATVFVDFGYPGVYTLYCTISWEDAYGNITLDRLYLDIEVENALYPLPTLEGAG